MDHEALYDNLHKAQSNTAKPPRRRKPRYIAMAVLAVALVGLAAWLMRSGPEGSDIENPGYKLYSTNLEGSYWTEVIDGNIYAYNGLAFSKTSPQDGKTTILASGLKLPKPERMHWAGDSGVLMTFKNSFALSEVERQLATANQRLNDITKDYAWYLDFATGKLQLVGDFLFVGNAVYYSQADKSFYYTVASQDGNELHRYQPASGTKGNIASGSLGLSDIRYINHCPGGGQICLVGRDDKDPKHQKLFAISANGQKTALVDSKGRLFVTNDPNLYIAVDRGPEEKDPVGDGDNAEEDITYPERPAILHDVSAKRTVSLGFDVGQPEITARFFGDGRFVVFSDAYTTGENLEESTTTNAYLAGEVRGDKAVVRLVPLVDNSDKPFAGSVVRVSSPHGADNTMMLSLAGGGWAAFSKQRPSLPVSQQSAAVQKAIDGCKQPGMVSDYLKTQRSFRVTFVADERYRASIASFGSCMARAGGAPFLDYRFEYAGMNSSGRFVTD